MMELVVHQTMVFGVDLVPLADLEVDWEDHHAWGAYETAAAGIR